MTVGALQNVRVRRRRLGRQPSLPTLPARAQAFAQIAAPDCTQRTAMAAEGLKN